MECKQAYLKEHIDYVLCKLEKEPDRRDIGEIAHAACIHQAHCPKKNCHKLTSEWVKCHKLHSGEKDAGEAAVKPTRRGKKKAED